MTVIFVLLLVLALVCFLLGALGVRVGEQRQFNLVALGLLFWVLVPLIQQINRL